MDSTFQNEIKGGSVDAVVQGDQNQVTINNYGGKGEQRTVPFLAPQLRRAALIGREDVFEEFKRMLLADDPDRVTALTYLVGVGKSALALRLAWDPDVLGKFQDGVLWASLGRTPNISALLGSWAECLGAPPEEMARRHTVENRRQAIKDRIGMSRMLLIVDDAWDVDAANAFVLGGPFCVHVLTTRLPGVATDLAQDGVVTVQPLSEDDGVALLGEFAPEAVKSEPEEARRLVHEVGGLPLALVIMGRYLAHESRTGRLRRVRAALNMLGDTSKRLTLEAPGDLLEAGASFPAGTKLSLLASIATSEATLSDEARSALRALSVLRPMPYTFDEDAAEAVTSAEPAVLDELEDAGLVEAVGEANYALQRTIAHYARAHLGDEAAVEFNRRALDYVNEKLRSYEERMRDSTPYERQYRYERSEWENLEEEFLFHASQADPESANLAFAQAYLDGFFWWGCYIPSPYCERRLRQWREHPPGPSSAEWIDAFSSFHDAYPTGYEKRGRGDWEAVEQSLHRIRELAGVDSELESIEGEERRHVRMLTDLFLAHASQYRDPAGTDADAYYAEARRLCEENEADEWVLPWIEYELGDLKLERGDAAKARACALEALALAKEAEPAERDHEVMANCFRLAADTAFPMAPDRSLAAYTLAAFYAYKFQGLPQPADFYTREFYREITDRTSARIEELWRDGQRDAALDWCATLHEFWRDYWPHDEGTVTGTSSVSVACEQALENKARDELRQVLFPAEPDEKNFGDQAWRERVSKLMDQMAPKVDKLEQLATS
jgi:hypothetical protein